MIDQLKHNKLNYKAIHGLSNHLVHKERHKGHVFRLTGQHAVCESAKNFKASEVLKWTFQRRRASSSFSHKKAK